MRCRGILDEDLWDFMVSGSAEPCVMEFLVSVEMPV
jgi:hypothetical protein